MLNQEQIKGKWNEIKGGIRNLWGNITDDELESLHGNVQGVAGIVQQKYGESKESIKKKLDSLMDSFDNETDKSLKLNDGEASYQRNPTSVRTSETDEIYNEDEVLTRSAGDKDNQPYSGSDRTGISAGAGTAGFKKSDLHDMDNVESDDEYDTEEIFDDSKNEDPNYEARTGSQAEDRIARH